MASHRNFLITLAGLLTEVMRRYRDKKLESWVKDLGGGGRGEPTIVTPKQCETVRMGPRGGRHCLIERYTSQTRSDIGPRWKSTFPLCPTAGRGLRMIMGSNRTKILLKRCSAHANDDENDLSRRLTHPTRFHKEMVAVVPRFVHGNNNQISSSRRSSWSL